MDTLHGPRITLRPLQASDADALVRFSIIDEEWPQVRE